MGKEEAANKAGYSRSAYYKHIENPNLEYHILMAYGKAIRHDFTQEFPDMPKYLVEEPEEIFGKPVTFEDAMKLMEAWRSKYYELIEQYNRELIEKYNRLIAERGEQK